MTARPRIAAVAALAAAPVALWALSAAAGTQIKVAGQPFDVGRPVVLWDDPEGFNGYARTCIESRAIASSACCRAEFNRFGTRKELKGRTLPALQAVVRQVVLHHDGCVNSRSCFFSMHDTPRPDGGCGLSAHFMVDADGTIYQTLDLLESAWHAEQANGVSIGIEICNRGDAGRNELDRLPREYRTRRVVDVTINGRTHHAFDFRSEQYHSVIALVRALVRLFPRVKPVFPERNGDVLLETLSDPSAFTGVVGHLHVDKQRQKWDPGAFDWPQLRRAMHAYYFPVALRGWSELPEDAEELRRAALVYIHNAEARASGFFPIGPDGVWHSGVHLRAAAGAGLRAPLRGRLVAARLASKGDSSTSFVLLRHDVAVAGEPYTFFTLLAHLQPEAGSSAAQTPWVRDLAARDARAARDLAAGRVVRLDVAVEAGDQLGAVGNVRRGPELGPEVHFEIFSARPAPAALGNFRELRAAAADGPLAAGAALRAPIDANRDGTITTEELLAFFREGDARVRQAFRQLEVLHFHEWGTRLQSPGEWPPRLRDTGELPAVWRDLMGPYVFWDDDLSKQANLPASQRVYSFHPITFLAGLAAAEHGEKISWLARASLPETDVAVAPPRAADFAPSERVARDLAPVFGPVVSGGAVIKKKADIPLLDLPRP